MAKVPYVQNLLFCDDVRTEVSGKDIAIGIYSGYIIVPQIPMLMPMLCLRMELFFAGERIEKFGVRVVDPQGSQMMENSADVNFTDWTRPGHVIIGMQGLIFGVPGNYSFQVNFGSEWLEVRTLRVEKVDPDVMRKSVEGMHRRILERLDSQS